MGGVSACVYTHKDGFYYRLTSSPTSLCNRTHAYIHTYVHSYIHTHILLSVCLWFGGAHVLSRPTSIEGPKKT